MIELLAYRTFMRLWFARLAGTAAAQMLMLAIGWHMYQLTGSAWQLGLVGLAQFLPSVAVALPAGHAADRHDRAQLVFACLAAQGLVAAVLAGLTATGQVNGRWLLALSLVLGAIRPFQMSAQQALTPLLVPHAMLSRATAFSAAGMQAAIIGGPALAGLLVAAGTQTVYAVCAVLFVLGSGTMLTVRYARTAVAAGRATVESLLAGLRFISASPVLLGAISLDLFAVLLGGATALLPIYADEILHVGPAGLGLLRAAPAVGALVTATVLARAPIVNGVGRKLMATVAVFGACMVVFGLSRNVWLSLAALAFSGAADMVSVVIRQTLVQLETPDAMRGRVAAVNTLFIGASNQLGEFESGATAALFGPVASVVSGGIGTLIVAGLWLRLFSPLARRDRYAPS